ncbi:hypothetical protein [Pseudoalteromonas sp. MMG022]|uniref:hypothetical protein n=1 Tax=Pseudoalteromonas sp. MMG022 TaxID=2909978 RepID=UPI001F37CED9|nr:hypothetical protein [Pseudoalteromonas sp. MMG022]MCF6434538.1 hypothetical protein [Pseudoalteromonas sp. MMG022]
MKRANLLNMFNIGSTNAEVSPEKLVSDQGFELSHRQCSFIASAGPWKPPAPYQASNVLPLPLTDAQDG